MFLNRLLENLRPQAAVQIATGINQDVRAFSSEEAAARDKGL
jgi:hypothetical protein